MATVYLTGFDAGTGVGGPPRLVEGRTVRDDGEIVLDKSFAAKFGFRPGDLLRIQDTDLAVVGISSGTNAFVIQYAFVTLARAQSFLGLPDTVTCFMVKLEPGAGPGWVTGEIRRLFPGSEVYDHQTFLENNIREMETGFLPFLYTIAFLGVVVLTAILSLILTVNILEKRRDFAVLKTLGSPGSYLAGLVAGQALLICASGIVWGTAFFFPLTAGVERIVPEVAARTSPWQMALIASAALAIGLVSSTVSLQRLRRIYALEAFA